jgi:5-methyltetrahydrofolate--homocysteine methyltransferase
MGIVNAGQLAVYEEIPKQLLELVEDVLLNRRPDATERLVTFAESVKQKGKVEVEEQSWRQGTVEERLSRALVRGIVATLMRTPKKHGRNMESRWPSSKVR